MRPTTANAWRTEEDVTVSSAGCALPLAGDTQALDGRDPPVPRTRLTDWIIVLLAAAILVGLSAWFYESQQDEPADGLIFPADPKLIRDGNIRALAFSPDGSRLATGEGDGAVRVWDLSAGRQKTIRRELYSIWAVAWSPDGKTLAVGSGNWVARSASLVLLEPDSGQVLRTVWQTSTPVLAVSFSPDGAQLAAGNGEGTLNVWSLPGGEVQNSLKLLKNQIHSIAFAPAGGALAVGGADGEVRTLDSAGSAAPRALEGHEPYHTVWSVAYSPDGQTLATAGDGPNVILWNTASGMKQGVVRLPKEHSARVVRFSHDGDELLIGAQLSVQRGELFTYRLTGGNARLAARAACTPVLCGSLSPDGRQLVVAGVDPAIELWNVDAMRKVRWSRFEPTLKSAQDIGSKANSPSSFPTKETDKQDNSKPYLPSDHRVTSSPR